MEPTQNRVRSSKHQKYLLFPATDLTGKTNMLTILRTQLVSIRRLPCFANGFDAVEPLYGLQGVRSSSLLGSIEISPLLQAELGGKLGGFDPKLTP